MVTRYILIRPNGIKNLKFKSFSYTASVLILFFHPIYCLGNQNTWSSLYPENNFYEENYKINKHEIYFRHAYFYYLKRDYKNTVITLKNYNLLNKNLLEKNQELFIKAKHLYISSLINLDMPILALSKLDKYYTPEKNNALNNYWYRTSISIAKLGYQSNSQIIFNSAIDLSNKIELNSTNLPKEPVKYKKFLLSQARPTPEENYSLQLDDIKYNSEKLELWGKDKHHLPISDLDDQLLEALILQNVGLMRLKSGKADEAINFLEKSNKALSNAPQNLTWRSTDFKKANEYLTIKNTYYYAKSLFIGGQEEKALNLLKNIKKKDEKTLMLAGWSAYNLEKIKAAKQYWQELSMLKRWSIEKLESLLLLPKLENKKDAKKILEGYLLSESEITKSLKTYEAAKDKLSRKNLTGFFEQIYHQEDGIDSGEISENSIIFKKLNKRHKSLIRKNILWNKIRESISKLYVEISRKDSESLAQIEEKWIENLKIIDDQISLQVSKEIQRDIDYLNEMLEKNKLLIISLHERVKIDENKKEV